MSIVDIVELAELRAGEEHMPAHERSIDAVPQQCAGIEYANAFNELVRELGSLMPQDKPLSWRDEFFIGERVIGKGFAGGYHIEGWRGTIHSAGPYSLSGVLWSEDDHENPYSVPHANLRRVEIPASIGCKKEYAAAVNAVRGVFLTRGKDICEGDTVVIECSDAYHPITCYNRRKGKISGMEGWEDDDGWVRRVYVQLDGRAIEIDPHFIQKLPYDSETFHAVQKRVEEKYGIGSHAVDESQAAKEKEEI